MVGVENLFGGDEGVCPDEAYGDFFTGNEYSSEVLEKMEIGDYHSFPLIIDKFQDAGTVTEITGNDGITREMLRISGTINGVEGDFEYIKEPDGTISHHFFNTNPH